MWGHVARLIVWIKVIFKHFLQTLYVGHQTLSYFSNDFAWSRMVQNEVKEGLMGSSDFDIFKTCWQILILHWHSLSQGSKDQSRSSRTGPAGPVKFKNVGPARTKKFRNPGSIRTKTNKILKISDRFGPWIPGLSNRLFIRQIPYGPYNMAHVTWV